MMPKKFGKTASYVVPSLFAAGMVAEPAIAEIDGATSNSAPADLEAKSLVSEISKQQTYTLAGHSSHGSHGSHGSHSSHSSYSGINLIQEEDAKNTEETLIASSGMDGGRNESSTPRSAILPSTLATAEKRKLKTLPGNSKKFADIVRQAQVALSIKGYNVGAINGELHARTIAALFEYQSSVGLLANGKLNPETLSAIGIVAG